MNELILMFAAEGSSLMTVTLLLCSQRHSEAFITKRAKLCCLTIVTKSYFRNT